MLVVDDHPIFRDGLRASLAEAPDLELCGEASTPAEATNAVERLAPDVVLMDVDLAGESGIEVTHRVTQDHPEVAVLMLTMHGAESTVFAAVCAGAVGYLLKGSGGTELHRAVRAAAAGEAIFGAGVARRVLSRLQAPQPHQAGPDHNLTVREREILDLMAGGLGNHAIAGRLSVAPKTVRNNVSSIRSKLRAASRLEAVESTVPARVDTGEYARPLTISTPTSRSHGSPAPWALRSPEPLDGTLISWSSLSSTRLRASGDDTTRAAVPSQDLQMPVRAPYLLTTPTAETRLRSPIPALRIVLGPCAARAGVSTRSGGRPMSSRGTACGCPAPPRWGLPAVHQARAGSGTGDPPNRRRREHK